MDSDHIAAGSMWEPQQVLALDLCLFSCRRLAILLRNPGDRMRITSATCLVSRLLLSAKSRNCMQACIQFDGLIDGLLAMALMNNGEGSGDAGLLVSEILQHLAMGAWHSLFFVGNCYGPDMD